LQDNISHFSLLVRLARLALIFSREASLIFHKILARKIAKRDSLSNLARRLDSASHVFLRPTPGLDRISVLQ
jgi:hypothetical protein